MITRDSRQGFLGPHARSRLNTFRAGVVGYGGGGSHIGQQLSHVLVPNLTIFEPQLVEDTNLNRLVGATEEDIGKPKLLVAERITRGLMPGASTRLIDKRWQDAPEELRCCDVVIGCVDSPHQRWELEKECRRWLIPYVDIGLGITLPVAPEDDPVVAGQVAMSVPGEHCLWCFGILSDRELERAAANYGDQTPAPQVVFANGSLASTAVDWVIEMLAAWRKKPTPHRYLRWSSGGLMTVPIELKFRLPKDCPHYVLGDAGEWDPLESTCRHASLSIL